MMATLMSVACIAGAFCVVVVILLLRLKRRQSRSACLIAALFPPATMAYWLGCLIVSAMLSRLIGTPDLLFGDINEALPNGYRLTALDKMPEAGRIAKDGDSIHGVAWVGSVQVEGPYVLGHYDYTYFPRKIEEAERNYFLFDTRGGQTTDFANEDQLASAVKRAVNLTPTESFHGPRSSGQRISMVAFLIAGAAPLAVGFWLLFRFMAWMKSPQKPLAVDG
ncbi:hypothetical protein [Occallatibacter riparius]|uniref:Uncharacterized protein n=1 Tax=Occallatibacter riparius TaxID=1002689 RepID=A0A9J7BKJ8_9BACT|nr:hypothetical protein [Occallatibacter riparius]UWZ83183.1 hypothetical protein MOP44_21755 [Occallatibacter riparius]